MTGSEGDPEGHDGARPPASVLARRRLVAATVAALVLTGVAAGGILALREDPDSPTDYDADVAEQFLSVCTADATDLGFSAPDAFCRCSYDRISVEVPFDRFLEIDARMAEDPGAVPDEIDRIRTDCFVGTAADPTPTTAPPAGA